MSVCVDPYYLIKDQINSELEVVKTNVEQLCCSCSSNKSIDERFIVTRKKTMKDVRRLEMNVNSLNQAVKMIEANRAKFHQIDQTELDSRILFIMDSLNAINGVNDRIHSELIKDKLSAFERDKFLMMSDAERELKYQQDMIIREQDRSLGAALESLKLRCEEVHEVLPENSKYDSL